MVESYQVGDTRVNNLTSSNWGNLDTADGLRAMPHDVRKGYVFPTARPNLAATPPLR